MLVDGIPNIFFPFFFVIQNVIIKIGANATAINKHFGSFEMRAYSIFTSSEFTIRISVALEIEEKSHEKINLVRFVHFPSLIKFIGCQRSSLT